MNMNEKIKKFEQSCEKLAQIDAEKMNEKLNKEIEEQIESDLEEYIKKQEVLYNKQCEKVVKEYNKAIFDYELNCKKNIQNVKQIINRELKEEVERRINNFKDSDEYYTQYLVKSINTVLELIENHDKSIIYVTKKDYEKYKNILMQFGVEVRCFEDSYIGGCKLVNYDYNLIADNTIKNNIEEIFNNSSLNYE